MIEYKINEAGKLVKLDNGDNFNSQTEYKTLYKEVDINNDSGDSLNAPKPEEKMGLFKRIMNAPGVKFKVKLTPYEKKVFSEVKDFWTKDLFNFK